jgi:hypothetical protein
VSAVDLWRVAAAAVLILGGAAIGFAVAKKRYLAIALLPVVGLGSTALIPKGKAVQCRFGRGFTSELARPPELATAWVGWEATLPNPYCRLELSRDGTGRCALWREEGLIDLWDVTDWSVYLGRIEIALVSGERREAMHGEILGKAMSLEYFGDDGAITRRQWLGPLHLVPEGTQEEARLAVGEAWSR